MSYFAPANYYRAADGFTPPNMGGPTAVRFGFLYEADSSVKALFTLPAGAVVTQVGVNVVEAFNGTTVQTIHITHPTGTFGLSMDVSATGQILTGFIPGSLFTRFTEDTIVSGVHNDSVATTGTAVVWMQYMTRDA